MTSGHNVNRRAFLGTAGAGLAGAILWRPFRPRNLAAKYASAVYDSAKPFCGCLR